MGTKYEVNSGTGLITTAAGISLPTTGGTATTLDFYEVFTHSTTWGNIWASSQAGDIECTRIGNVVTLFVPSMSANATVVSKIQNNSAFTIPFRPLTTINFVVRIFDDSTAAIFGTGQVLTTGHVNISVGPNRSNFAGSSGGGASGVEAFCCTYTV